MDQLPALGKAIGQIVQPTFRIYNAILQKHADDIKSTPRKTFTYGTDPRQQLDVYYPKSNPSGAGCPILIFLYGGGLVNGAKILPFVENGLVYANIGHFFAENHGFVVVILDYRLVPQAKFPSGGEDLALAVDWVNSNLKNDTTDSKSRNLFIMGNSAGGVHLSTYLFSPVFAEARKAVLTQGSEGTLSLKGAVLLSVPLHFELADPGRAGTLEQYYGDQVNEHCPFGLMKAVKDKGSISELLPGVRFLALTGTLDPEDEILKPNKDFTATWKSGAASGSSELEVYVMEGHNHISPPLALSTGNAKDEAWGSRVATFCKTAAQS